MYIDIDDIFAIFLPCMDFEVGKMDENDSERNIFFAALLTVAISGGAVVLINHKTGTRKDRMSRVLMEQLWGFSPRLEGAARYQFYVWSWRKLILAGVMLSSMCLAVTCRMMNLQIAIHGTSILFSLWLGGFTLFWFLYIKPYWIDDDTLETGKAASKDEQVTRSGWNEKILHKASLNDDRLPLTVVTGYLYVQPYIHHFHSSFYYHLLLLVVVFVFHFFICSFGDICL